MATSSNPDVLIVTGGSRGIGAATSRLAAKHGWRVVINYRTNQSAAENIQQKINKDGGYARCCRADISDEKDVMTLFNWTASKVGRIGGLVNNAGTLETQMRLDQMDGDRLDRVFATNVRGSFLCAREVIKTMSTRYGGVGGTIVNVSSAASRLGSAGEYIDYAASKDAIDSMTIGLANEVVSEGVRVNAVRPGFIETEIHALGGEPNRLDRVTKTIPLARAGKPEEIAEAIIWLLSDKSSYCTGSFIDCAGGR